MPLWLFFLEKAAVLAFIGVLIWDWRRSDAGGESK